MDIEDGYIIVDRSELDLEDGSPTKKKPLTVNDFLLVCVLGKGSYAKVVLVRKKDNQQIYALKILKKDHLQKRNQQTKVKSERDILIEVNHPFIVKLYHAFQNERKLYFALEYCPGGELFNLLQKLRRFSEDQARFYAAQIILAIQHLHSKGVIYRDLKPENVLLDKDGYIRITDFGLSRTGMTDGTNAFSVCGTPEYLAPEILSRKGYGKSVDWWTLGALLYEMLTGMPPFYTPNREELFNRIKFSKLKYPSDLSVSARDLLEKLLVKEPELRLGSGTEGAMEIRNHKWFDRVEWDSILLKQVKAPFVPTIKGEIDVSNFDTEFTETPVESFKDSSVMEEKMNTYNDWTFTGESMKKSLLTEMESE